MTDLKGVHHIGLGVKDYNTMKAFYTETLSMTEVMAEFPEILNAMPEVFRNADHKFSGGMFYPKSGGIIVELIKIEIPTPRPLRKENRYGDIGVNKIGIAVSNINTFYTEYRDKINFCSEPITIALPGLGEHEFVYATDPEGNYLEFVSNPNLQKNCGFGGSCWLGVSVSDLERSIEFYRSFGFDTIEVQPHDGFSGHMTDAAGSVSTQVRSCLMANSNGLGMLELSEIQNPSGRSIPLNSRWGDFGFFEIALESDDIHEAAAFCREDKMDFLHKPALAFEDNNVEMWFMYVYDPDGIPVEVIAAMPKS